MIIFPGLIVGLLFLIAAGYSRGGLGALLAVFGLICLLGSLTYRPVFYPMFYGYPYYSRPPILVTPGYRPYYYRRPYYRPY